MKKFFTTFIAFVALAATALADKWTPEMVIDINRIAVSPSQSEVQTKLQVIIVEVDDFESLNSNLRSSDFAGKGPIVAYKIAEGADLENLTSDDLSVASYGHGDYDYYTPNRGYVMLDRDLASAGSGYYLINVPEGQFADHYPIEAVTPNFQLIYQVDASGYVYRINVSPSEEETVDEFSVLTARFIDEDLYVNIAPDEQVQGEDGEENFVVNHHAANIYDQDGNFYCTGEYFLDPNLQEQGDYKHVCVVPFFNEESFAITKGGTYTVVINEGDLMFGDITLGLAPLAQALKFKVNVSGNKYNPATDGIQHFEHLKQGVIFDLSGRKAKDGKGIRIIDGKKVIK